MLKQQCTIEEISIF